MLQAMRGGFAGLFDTNRGLRLTLLGFPVLVHWTFWLSTVAIGWRRSPDLSAVLEWIAVVFVSVFAHELGHAFVAARRGTVFRITLHGLGGETRHRPFRVRWRESVLVWLAGPFAGFALAAVSSLLLWALLRSGVGAVLPGASLARLTLGDLVSVNVAWTLFNLLPIPPLDGGAALRTWLVARWYGRGAFASALVAVLAAVAALFWALAGEQGWATLIVGFYGFQNALLLKGHVDEYRDAHRHTRWSEPSRGERRLFGR